MSKAVVLTGFNPYTHRGGIETFTLALISLLEQSGLEVTVHWNSQYENRIGLNNDWWGRVYQMGSELARQGKSAGSLVFINGYYGFGYRPKVLPTYTLFHSTHFGYAEAVRDLVPESAYLAIRHVVGELMERSAAEGAKVLAVSEEVSRELERGYGLTDVTCVSNPVDTDFYSKLPVRRSLRKKYGLPEDASIGLYVGRWEKAKAIDLVEGLFRQLPETRWVLALAPGRDSPLPEKENVIILDSVAPHVMRELYSLADFLIFPSHYEGFGLAAAEAMSCGLPVIGTPVGFLKRVYQREPFARISLPMPGRSGIDTQLRAAKAFIRLLMDDRELNARLSAEGRDVIKKKCGLTSWQSEMREILCLS